MSENNQLITSIVTTVSDYREGDIPAPTPERVERWINQFQDEVRSPILHEMDHVLKSTYISRNATTQFLKGLFSTQELVGNDPCQFWKNVRFLNLQDQGASQKEMLALFSNILVKNCGFEVATSGENPAAFVYLDDAIFTGNRVRRDLEAWVTDSAPNQATVHIITLALHSGGAHYASGKIRETARKVGKTVNIKLWRAVGLEPDSKLG